MEALRLTRVDEPVLALTIGETIEWERHEGDVETQAIELVNVGNAPLRGKVGASVDWLTVDGEDSFEIPPGGYETVLFTCSAMDLTEDASPYRAEIVIQSNCGINPMYREPVVLTVMHRPPTELVLDDSSIEFDELLPGTPTPTARPERGWPQEEGSAQTDTADTIVVRRADDTPPLVEIDAPPWISASTLRSDEDGAYIRLTARLPKHDESGTFRRDGRGRIIGKVIFKDREDHVDEVALTVSVGRRKSALGRIYPREIELGDMIPKVPEMINLKLQNFGNFPLKATIPRKLEDAEGVTLERVGEETVLVRALSQETVSYKCTVERDAPRSVQISIRIENDEQRNRLTANVKPSVYEHVQVAGRTQRALAWGLDVTFNLAAAALIVGAIFVAYGSWGLSVIPGHFAEKVGLFAITQIPDWLSTAVLVWLSLSPVYSIYCLAAHGTTVGKSLFGLKVIDRRNGFIVDGIFPAVRRYLLTPFGRLRPWRGYESEDVWIAWHDEVLNQVVARNDVGGTGEGDQ